MLILFLGSSCGFYAFVLCLSFMWVLFGFLFWILLGVCLGSKLGSIVVLFEFELLSIWVLVGF